MLAARPDGELLAGRYRVERLIARGGMGSVYLCQDTELPRAIALKVLNPTPDVEGSGRFDDRFKLEANTLAALNHPNIVTLYDYGQTGDGRFYLALEYVDGPRFTDLLRPGPLPVARAVGLMIQVCRALRYAHRRGVVHRDLKPSNLLVRVDDDGEEQVKVVDFGLVKVMEEDQSLTRAGLILGSPHCMAPEQIRGQEVDHRADIYAIGVLLFRMLAGRWPFHGETSTATMMAHLQQPAPLLSVAAPEAAVPAGLDALVAACMSKAPVDRPDDVTVIMDRLRELLGGRMGASPYDTLSGVDPNTLSAARATLPLPPVPPPAPPPVEPPAEASTAGPRPAPAVGLRPGALVGAGVGIALLVALVIALSVALLRPGGPPTASPPPAPAEVAPPAPTTPPQNDGEVNDPVEDAPPAGAELTAPAQPRPAPAGPRASPKPAPKASPKAPAPAPGAAPAPAPAPAPKPVPTGDPELEDVEAGYGPSPRSP
ncbi:MAG: serine/threonine protein kinase [Deltaproteobacteria bacterium]|jgi:hypothetical protein|nr:serine/threonine protein kinase [Deltaproteobacteria bacterium]